MRRLVTEPRPNWTTTVESQGLIYHTTELPDGSTCPYWSEDTYYEFSPEDIKVLERATSVLSHMCIAAAQEVIERDRFADMAIPAAYVDAIKASWNASPASVYGRFDLRFDGTNPPKLLEYNADTPTALVETGVIQWRWREDKFPLLDQWNSVHERLIAAWSAMKPYLNSNVLHVAHSSVDPTGEEIMNAAYMRDCANQAGLITVGLHVEDIGWDGERSCFVDNENKPIEAIFKLYPWEWMLAEDFGENILATWEKTGWIEPLWKTVLSNKGILAILWELFPGHPNLLPAYFGHPHELTQYVRKPLFSREGANILIVSDDVNLETEGEYGEEGFVFQEFRALPDFDGWRPVIGSWVINLEAAGCCIRESESLVTDNVSRLVPHVIGAAD